MHQYTIQYLKMRYFVNYDHVCENHSCAKSNALPAIFQAKIGTPTLLL